jgi:hypothetical protein
VIGETKIEGTNKLADGFICDPYTKQPKYAIEVGKGKASKFWADYEKSIETWADHNLEGVFILFFAESSTDEILRYDGADLRTPRKEAFHIHPLVIPLEPDFHAATKSITSARYWDRHVAPFSRSLLIISTRGEKESRKYIVDPLKESLFDQQKLLQFLFFDPARPPDAPTIRGIVESLRKTPPMAVIFPGTEKPLEAYDSDDCTALHEEIGNLIETREWKDNPPRFVMIGDNVDGASWKRDDAMWGLMPVDPIDEKSFSTVIHLWKDPRMFGSHILPVKGNTEEWGFLTSVDSAGVGGFVATKIRKPESGLVEVAVEYKNERYPFIARIHRDGFEGFFIASGVGGWGNRWLENDCIGYAKMWKRILDL